MQTHDTYKLLRKEQVQALPNLGLGLGLRHVHFDHILKEWPEVDWFEAISENFMYTHGRQLHVLKQVAEKYPIVMHGVSLSIGSKDPLNRDYLKALKALSDEIAPKWISDHLCWCGMLGMNTHDLLPLPLTEEAFTWVSKRVMEVQDFLERPLILENPSTYLSFTHSTIPEQDFLSQLVVETGCGLLLDVNNVYVSCFNAGTDPEAYIRSLPHESIVQMHLAGHQHCGTHIVDTHDRPVVDEVWELFRLAWKLTGGTSVLLEWDGNIPSFDDCLAELHKSRTFMAGSAVSGFRNEASAVTDSLPTPIDFLVPDIMSQTVTE